MDKQKQNKNPTTFVRNIFSCKNFFSLTENKSVSRNKLIFAVILIIGILLMTIPSEKSKQREFESSTEEENKLGKILSDIEGCGDVSVMITYSQPDKYGSDISSAKGAVVVAEGADDVNVCDKISEAVQAALDLPPHKVKVYKSKTMKG